MLWLIVIIIAYFLFAIATLGDRYLLTGPPVPKSYAFYVGILGGLALLLIPFVDFSIPDFYQVLLCFLTGALFIFGLLGLFEGLEKFEASRIIPAVGALTPIFTFFLVYFFSERKEILGLWELLAFLILLLGSVLISIELGKRISFGSLKISAITAFLFSLSFVLTKYVYLSQSFWTGFIWIRIGALLTALFFIFTKEVRKEIFSGKFTFTKKTGMFFVLNQGVGMGAFILQNWAIALTGLVYLSVINALQSVQYVFLFIFITLISLIWPFWSKRTGLKEELSKKVIFQKLSAILLIGAGLVVLAFG